MKSPFLLISLFFAALVVSATADTITTLRGKKYFGCKVVLKEPDGISFRHRDGVAKIQFTDLPSSLRSKYGYSPKKAAEYSRKIVEARKVAAEKRRVAEQKAAEEAEAAQFEALMAEHREHMRLYAESQAQQQQAMMQQAAVFGPQWPANSAITAVTAHPNGLPPVCLPDLPPIHGPVVDGKDVVKKGARGWDSIGISPLVYGSGGIYLPPSGGHAFYPPIRPSLGYARPGFGVHGSVNLGGGVHLGVGVRATATGVMGRR